MTRNNSFKIWDMTSQADFDAADLKPDMHRLLLDHWLTSRTDGSIPPKTALDPLRLRSILRNLLMVEVHAPPTRFLVRLAGTEIDDLMGKSSSGYWLDEFPNTEPIIERFNWILKNKRPYYAIGRHYWPEGHFKEYNTLTVPYSRNGTDVDYIVSSCNFYWKSLFADKSPE
ncbi:PAS domain-containing protein [Emcibacter sp.]|uniref:PAS domain-containing protein n=1 Tax=Emcibacter sp. TaxID=1979954 RepID=UPI002AA6F2CD|nr:PAS domain-containing protein [Emcibacter sp.]